jgi:hypothetical protein
MEKNTKVYSLSDLEPEYESLKNSDLVESPEPDTDPNESMGMYEDDTTNEVENAIDLQFVKAKRDQALLNIQNLLVQRHKTEETFKRIEEEVFKQKAYIAAWNDLLPESLRNDLPEEIVKAVQQQQQG